MKKALRFVLIVFMMGIISVNLSTAQPTDLFISEYIEGSSNNKAIEVYNGTGTAIDLIASSYKVEIYPNGATTPNNTINLTGTIADSDVFVLAHSSSEQTLLDLADQTSGSVIFNGNDAVVLKKGTTTLDVIGQIGNDPGSEWGSGATSTADNTLVRKSAICAGDTNGGDAFDPSSEWDGYASDTFTYLGSHTANCGSGCTAPTTQASNFGTSSVGETSMTVSWTRGNGDNVLVVAKSGSAVDTDPTSGTSYTANATFGSGDEIGTGNYVIYNGTGTSVNITNLVAGTTYHFAIYEYLNTDVCYNTTELTGSQSTSGTSGTITVSVTSLYSFGDVYENYYSDLQMYQVSASGLTADLTITAPTDFEVSLSHQSGFASSITLSPSGGSISETNIFVRFSPTSTGNFSGDISHASSGTSTKYVSVSGNGITNGIPGGYYSTATGTGATLKTQLKNIIDGHNSVSYDALWTHFQTTDDEVDGDVWDMYSDVPFSDPVDEYEFTFGTHQCGSYGGESDCYNREHSFPASWFGSTGDPDSDIFHLYPTDGYVNSMRSNHPFGEVSSPTWTSINGSKKGPNTYGGTYTSTVFEPIDEYKGDFARSYFYMATRYEDNIASWTSDVLAKNSYPAYVSWFVDMLLEWHVSDPVSQKEINRNDDIYNSIQYNRNPFIDHPEFASEIWATPPSTQASNFSASSPSPTSLTVNWNRGNGDSVLVVARQGSAVDTDPLMATIYSANSEFASGDEIGTNNFVVYKGTGTSVTVTGLSVATQYYFAIYEYESIGIAYNQNELTGNATTQSGNDMTTEISAPTTQITSGTIASTATSSGNAVDMFKFTVTDGGSGDGLATKITNIRIKPHTSNTADWSDNIQGVIVKKGASSVTISTPTITDGYLDIPIASGNLEIADGASSDITIGFYLNTSNIADNAILSFMVDADAHGFTADANGSGFPSTFSGGDFNSNNFTITVSPIQIQFVQQPTETAINTSISPAVTVVFTDANGNIDNDASGQTVRMTASGATLSGSPVDETMASSGIATFSALQFSTTGTGVTLTATDQNDYLGSSASVVSSSFNVTENTGPTLLIAEVADPSDVGNAKFVELYNTGNSTIDFGTETWYLSRQANGGSWEDIQLTGSISPGECYLIANNATDFEGNYGGFSADQYSTIISGNGDDGYFLYQNGDHTSGDLVDAYGVIDVDGTGENWDYTNSQAERNSAVTSPNATWTASEWTISSAAVADMTPGQHGTSISDTDTKQVPASDTNSHSFGQTGTTIQFTIGNSNELKLKVSEIFSDPGVGGGLPSGVVNLAREKHWRIRVTGSVDGTYSITLDLSALSGISDLQTLHLLKRNNSGEQWSDMGQPSEYASVTAVKWSGLTSFSEFSIGGESDNPLPVDLIDFYAELLSNGVRLNWRTASEFNNAGFYIYRDGERISNLIPGHGTTEQENSYSFVDQDVENDEVYAYQLSDVRESDGMETFHPEITVVAKLDDENTDSAPNHFALHQNYPNPFNPKTTISFDLPEEVTVRLLVYDIHGKLIKSLVTNRVLSAGRYSFEWDGTDNSGRSVGSGIYFCRLHGEIYEDIKRMLLMK